MPTYDYICEKCGHQFDLFQRITEPVLETCPKDKCGCKTWGKGRVKRQIGTGAGFIFKGSGFYLTDYRSDSYKAGAQKEKSAAASPTASSSNSGSASKPASGGSESKAPAPAANNKS